MNRSADRRLDQLFDRWIPVADMVIAKFFELVDTISQKLTFVNHDIDFLFENFLSESFFFESRF